MEIIKCSLPSDYELIISSDLHLGAGTVSEEPIEQMVEYVRSTKNCYMTNIGDNIEAITPNDKRFSFSKSPYKTTQEQADAVIRLFTPIKDKTLAIGLGNHEFRLINTLNVAEYIANALGVPNGMYNYILHVNQKKSGRLMHKMYMTHGAGHISSMAKDEIQAEANMKAALKNKLNKSGFSDVIAMICGHVHKFIIVEPTMMNKLHLTTDDGNIKQHYRHLEKQNSSFIPPDGRWYASNGSMMKTYSTPGTGQISYGEAFGYSPSEVGMLKCTIQNGNLVNIEAIKL